MVQWFNDSTQPAMQSCGLLFRVAEVQDAPVIALHMHGIMHSAPDHMGAGSAALVQAGNTANIVLRLPEMRNPRAARDRARTGVISRQTQAHVAAIAVQQSS